LIDIEITSVRNVIQKEIRDDKDKYEKISTLQKKLTFESIMHFSISLSTGVYSGKTDDESI